MQAPFFLANRRKYKFLGDPVGVGINSHSTARSLLYRNLHCFSPQQTSYVAFRIVGLHFLKKHIPHLIVWTLILDLPHHFIVHTHRSFLLSVYHNSVKLQIPIYRAGGLIS